MQAGRLGVGIVPREQVLFGNLAGQRRPQALQVLLPATEKNLLLINAVTNELINAVTNELINAIVD